MTKGLIWIWPLALLFASDDAQQRQPQSSPTPSNTSPTPGTKTGKSDAATSGRPSSPVDQQNQEPNRSAAPKVGGAPARRRSKAVLNIKTEPRPFHFNWPSIDPTVQASGREFPPPPMLLHSPALAAPNSALSRQLSDVGKATSEPANLTGTQRLRQRFSGSNRVVDRGNGFTPARPLHDILFVMPHGAIPAVTQTQSVDLRASVDATGHVTRVELLAPLDEELVTFASYAANDWHFAPAKLKEKPVASEVILHFKFGGN